jgi:hypothetical protein
MYITVEGMTTAGISTTPTEIDMEDLMRSNQQNSARNMERQYGNTPGGAGGTRSAGGG